MIYYIENKELEQYIRVLKNLMGSRLQLAQNCSLSLFCVACSAPQIFKLRLYL